MWAGAGQNMGDVGRGDVVRCEAKQGHLRKIVVEDLAKKALAQ